MPKPRKVIKILSSVFSWSYAFNIFNFIFRSMSWVHSSFSFMWISIFLALFVKNTLFSPLNLLCTTVKSQVFIYFQIYFCAFYWSIYPYLCQNYTVLITFGFSFFFLITLAILGPLDFHMNFIHSISISTKKLGFWLQLFWIHKSVWEEFTF